MVEDAFRPKSLRYSTGVVETDPFVLDGVHLLILLMHFDSDQAKDLNYVGFSRDASPEAHTIYTWLKAGHKVDLATIQTIERIIEKHIRQASEHLADVIGVEANVLESILRQRTDLWTSPRIKARITNDAKPLENFTYLFVSGDAIQLHFGKTAPRVAHVFIQYRAEILADAGSVGQIAESFFARHDYEGSGQKTINGKRVPYRALLFPQDATVARELIEHLELFDSTALIDHSVHVLAASHSGVEHQPPTNPKPRS